VVPQAKAKISNFDLQTCPLREIFWGVFLFLTLLKEKRKGENMGFT